MSLFDLSMPIAVGSDHAGYEYKQRMLDYLRKKDLRCLTLALKVLLPQIIPILRTRLRMLLKQRKPHSASLFVGVQMVWPSLPINIRASGPPFAGKRILQNLPASTTTQTSSACRHDSWRLKMRV